MVYFHANQWYTFMRLSGTLSCDYTEKDSRTRKVALPQGEWQAEDGKKFKGGSTIEIAVPLERLPYFRMIN